MALVLVVEDDPDLRDLVVDVLTHSGHDVTTAEDGRMALEKAKNEKPEIVLLDVMMPAMDGFEVLTKLRQDPDTQNTPVVMLTAFPAVKGEPWAWGMGVRHYLSKPFDPELVQLAVKVALREAEGDIDEQAGTAKNDEGEERQEDLSPDPKTSNVQESEAAIKTGNGPLDERLGGGIPCGSFTLIDGPSSSGKSVLGQHLAYGSLLGGRGVAFITSENTVASLSNKMASIGMNVSQDLEAGRLQIFPLDLSISDPHPELTIEYLVQDIEHLPSQYEVIIVDSLTDILSDCQDRTIISSFSRCKRLCDDGRTVILAIHTGNFEQSLLTRLRALSDAHFNLTLENVRGTLVRGLEVRKAYSPEVNTDSVLPFEVVPGIGMRLSSITIIKV